MSDLQDPKDSVLGDPGHRSLIMRLRNYFLTGLVTPDYEVIGG